jgi:hypothetical protein
VFCSVLCSFGVLFECLLRYATLRETSRFVSSLLCTRSQLAPRMGRFEVARVCCFDDDVVFCEAALVLVCFDRCASDDRVRVFFGAWLTLESAGIVYMSESKPPTESTQQPAATPAAGTASTAEVETFTFQAEINQLMRSVEARCCRETRRTDGRCVCGVNVRSMAAVTPTQPGECES